MSDSHDSTNTGMLQALQTSAKHGEFGDYALDFLLSALPRPFNGTTALHVAIANKHAGLIPVGVLTDSNLCMRDSSRQTPLRLMARYGGLKHLSEFTLNNLMTRKYVGDSLEETPLHDAAAFGWLHELPKSIITVDNLLIENFTRTTPLYYATKGCISITGKQSEMELLLGLDFPISVKHIVGDEWWEQNEEIKSSIRNSKAGVTDIDAEDEVALF